MLSFGFCFTSCDEKLDFDLDTEPPSFNAATWQGKWQGTNRGTINGSHITITFTANGFTEAWIANDGPRSFTVRFDEIIPVWNYRSDTKSEYPSGYIFRGEVTHTVNSYELKSKTWHEFYLSIDNTSMMYDNSGTFAVFDKQ